MASDTEIARGMTEYLHATGNICGRSYADVGKVIREIQASLVGETEKTLRPKVERIIDSGAYGFKSRSTEVDRQVSASDPRCGS